jgi:t-SNARE complex subunit (syntaxin)
LLSRFDPVVDTDKSLQTLQGELEQLLTLFQDFNELVHAQQPMIDQCTHSPTLLVERDNDRAWY